MKQFAFHVDFSLCLVFALVFSLAACYSGYSELKISENVQCEIMRICADEARGSYAADIVHELPSNTVEDMESNLERAKAWLGAWLASRTT